MIPAHSIRIPRKPAARTNKTDLEGGTIKDKNGTATKILTAR
jgi:hypothetical protein